ncbi:MAG: lectin like domain-containing protein, partial [Deltaproteobacteria bacterium]
DDNFFDSDSSTFYQPPSSQELPNHAVAIVGWDDNKVTSAPKKGAWLIKNSWGTGFGENGYFWISYYDKTSGHHPQMGAVSFKNVEPLKYNKIYTLDYHGWRDTLETATEAFNAFTSEGGPKGIETLRAVSFVSATDDVDYIVSIYRNFNQGQLSGLVSLSRGALQHTGFHTVDLETPVLLNQGDKFYVKVSLSKGGHAFDKTSDVPVLLGGSSRTIVESRAKAGESFYNKNGSWVDLTTQDKSANFCIKALTDYYL